MLHELRFQRQGIKPCLSFPRLEHALRGWLSMMGVKIAI